MTRGREEEVKAQYEAGVWDVNEADERRGVERWGSDSVADRLLWVFGPAEPRLLFSAPSVSAH